MLLTTVTIISLSLITRATAQDVQVIPQALLPCFPTPTGVMTDIANGQSYQLALLTPTPVLEVDSRAPYRHYYLFVVYAPWAPDQLDYTLIAQDQRDQCQRVAGPGSSFDLTWDISFESARQLALVFYSWLHSTPEGQHWIKALIAPPDYTDEEEDLLYLSAEQAWALQQLGYQIPEDYEVLEPGTPAYLQTSSN